jgi:hypothetical protein
MIQYTIVGAPSFDEDRRGGCLKFRHPGPTRTDQKLRPFPHRRLLDIETFDVLPDRELRNAT